MFTIMAVLSTVLLLYILLINVSGIKCTKSELLFIIIISQIVATVFSIIPNMEILGNLSVVVMMILFIYRKNKSIALSIVYSILVMILVISFNNVSEILTRHFFDAGPTKTRANLAIYCFNYIITFILSFLSSVYLGNLFEKKLKIFSLDLKNKFSVYIICGAILTLALFYTNMFLSRDMLAPNTVIIINSALLLLYFVFFVGAIYAFIVSIKNTVDIEHKQALLEQLQHYTTNIENLYTEMRGFQHDYINLLSSLYSYIESSDIEGIKKYFSKHIAPMNEKLFTSNNHIAMLKNMLIPELKGILSIKFMYAQELNINVHIEIFDIIEKINLDIVDLCRVVGILIDNAIEECQKGQSSSLKFVVIKEITDIKLIFINTLIDPPKLSQIFEKGYSTKRGNRGFGLYNLRQITEKHTNILINTLIKENEFVQELVISNN